VDRRKLDIIFKDLGGSIRIAPKQGEVEYNHPRWAHPLRFNSRRKDVPRCAVVAVRRLVEHGQTTAA
jgi:hypothetical protein